MELKLDIKNSRRWAQWQTQNAERRSLSAIRTQKNWKKIFDESFRTFPKQWNVE